MDKNNSSKKSLNDLIVRPGENKIISGSSGDMAITDVIKKFGTRRLSSKITNLFWCVDKTGSMISLIQKAKSASSEFFKRSQDAGINLEVCWAPYGDYVDHRLYGASGLIECREWTRDVEALTKWIEETRITDGGDEDEAVEYILAHALAESHKIDAVILIGDAGPHEEAEAIRQVKYYNIPNQWSLDWRKNAKALGEKGIPIYTFSMSRGCEKIFKEIADLSGGQTGNLDQINDLTDMLTLTAVAVGGDQKDIQKYLERYKGQMNPKTLGYARRLSLPDVSSI